MTIDSRHMLGIVSVREECEHRGITSDYAIRALELHGVDVDRSESSDLPSTTLEETGSGLRYRVVDGHKIVRHLPDLFSFYRSTLLTVAQTMTGKPLVPQDHLRGAVSLNEIEGPGGRYERHMDDSSFTAVLYFETRDPSEGGALELEGDALSNAIRICPVEYLLVVFTGRDWAHAVSPNRSSRSRRCLVANYWLTGAPQDRPEGLDDYLYGTDRQ